MSSLPRIPGSAEHLWNVRKVCNVDEFHVRLWGLFFEISIDLYYFFIPSKCLYRLDEKR